MDCQYTFRRTEKKYLLTPGQYALLQERLRFRLQPDAFGLHTISSLYYDTPDFLLVRTSLEHPVFKQKLRLRGYTDTPLCFPEIKQKYRGVVYKRRIACTPEAWAGLREGIPIPGQSMQIQEELRQLFHLYPSLAPRVLIAYDRCACTCAGDKALRITFDHRLRARSEGLSLSLGSDGDPLLPEGHVVMEVKFPEAAPLWLAELLSDCRVYPSSFSKVGRWYRERCAGVSRSVRQAM